MTTKDFSVVVKRYSPTDPRLGRHVLHDSRSRAFAVEAAPLSTLKSVRHQSQIPVLDQGNLGSCTGNASTNVLGTAEFLSTVPVKSILSTEDAGLDEEYAVSLYSAATKVDPYSGSYPPTDTGSNGLSVAKVLQKAGKISGYQHAFSLEATLTALAKGACMVGTVWRGDMFNPGSDGRIKITGNEEGGHEYKLDELDVENKRVWFLNSWTRNWGVQGRAWVSWDDLGTLLADSGDCTVFTPVSQPAPQPTPTPPAPTPPTPPAPPAPPTPVDVKAEIVADLKAALAKLDTLP